MIKEEFPVHRLDRYFSKRFAQELRDETAKELRGARGISVRAKDWSLEDVDYYAGEHGRDLHKRLTDVSLRRLFKTKEYRDDLSAFADVTAHAKNHRIDEARRNYQEQLKNILNNEPLSRDEMDFYLPVDRIKGLDTKDYLTLCERLSGYTLNHVSRWGLRLNWIDGGAGGGHKQGFGTYLREFAEVLRDGALKSKQQRFIDGDDSINESLKRTSEELEPGHKVMDEMHQQICHDYYAGGSAGVHFSSNDFLTGYGCEPNYDVSVKLPLEVALYNFLNDINGRGPIGQLDAWNDNCIFEDVPLDAGFVFIPGDLKVDPETGSQYLVRDGRAVYSSEELKQGFDDVASTGNIRLLRDYLNKANPLQRPDSTVTSEEFWGNYFAQHPEEQPNHLIYGSDRNFGNWDLWESYKHLVDKNNIHTDPHASGSRHTPQATAFFDQINDRTKKSLEQFIQEESLVAT